MDAKHEDKINKYNLNKYCAVLAKEFDFAHNLNSTARQASAERAWSSISRFYDNCKKKVPGKKAMEARVGASSPREHSSRQVFQNLKNILVLLKTNIQDGS